MSFQESGPSFAVVNVTGDVDQEFLSVLSDRHFPYRSIKLMASKCSIGKSIFFKGRIFTVQEFTANSFNDVDVVIFSASGSISKELNPIANEKGVTVVIL
ncbi:hypothetical protein CRYUN_Cryun20dG0077300 [Craigia yunnanensis]